MKLPFWNLSPDLLHQNRKFSSSLILLSVMGVAGNLAAQPVISAPSEPSYVPAALPQAPATDSILPGFLETSLFQWGPVTLHPNVSYQYRYGDGIQANPGQQSKTSVNTISLGILAAIGTHWSLNYSPSKTYYSNSNFSDSFDQSLSLLGGTSFEK